MELVNTTPLPCDLVVGLSTEEPDAKLGAITAKATFNVGDSGQIALEQDVPYPLLQEDQDTPLGALPTDLPVRRGPELEVMALAAAYAPGGRAVTDLAVTLSIGAYSQSIRVVGDRRWLDGPDGAVLTAPAPFARMPLVWERAFGGTAEVWLDERSTTEVMHSLNPRGRGFDPSHGIANLGKHLYVADGFPRTAYEAWAPNLESPEAPIRSRHDQPKPHCFAPTPIDCGLQMEEAMRRMDAPPEQRPLMTELFRRAHPAWVLERAPLGQTVRLTNCRPDGELTFVLPTAVPVMDYVLGDRTGTRDLTPQFLVLLPEERRFYIVYRHFFTMRAEPSDERSIRLRYQ